MRIGKVKESILKRSVLRQLHNHSEKGSPAPGEDAGVLFMPEFMPEFTQGFSGKNGVAMAVNPVEGWTFAAKRAVYGAVIVCWQREQLQKRFRSVFLCRKKQRKNS